MIPWRLSFTGIRDYPGVLMDLSERDQHVLITGPNGSGKSTITYCMGAVLYSSKVDVEGLKSRNLAADETWKAQIAFLFKNDGAMKIDAPAYIQFLVRIVQEPGQPMKKEFVISTGDEIDQWGESTRYTSGDSRYNFTAYKKDLMFKYKVDPDLFYLIWYQQEVNQFAVMHPEERFRIFSEMHGIDKAQRDWEASMEAMKETKETLRSAEINMVNSKFMLSLNKKKLDQYEDNQRRLNEGGMRYVQSLLQLEAYYKKEQEELERSIEELMLQITDIQDELALKRENREKVQESLNNLEIKLEQLEIELENNQAIVDKMKSEVNVLKKFIGELEEELKEITERQKLLTRTEEEVKQELLRITEQLMTTRAQQENIQHQLVELEQQWRDRVQSVAELKQQISNDKEQERKHIECLQQYESSHRVQEHINRLDQTIQENKHKSNESSRTITSLKEELQLLEDKRDLSVRQLESIKYIQSLRMQAYPLRELVELDQNARLKDEERFNTIKYTIFFDGDFLLPPNDLYHVPLRKIIPERSITTLPSLHLRVKEGLEDTKIPYAMKVLWWIEQFFKDGAFVIRNGALIDQMGIRGAQEKERFILSAKALEARKQEIRKLIEELSQSLEELNQSIARDTKAWQELNGIIHSVKQAEAFMTHEHERTARKRKLENEHHLEQQILNGTQKLKQKQKELLEQVVKQEDLEQKLQEDAAFYEKLGQLKGRYELLSKTQKEYDELQNTIKQQLKLIEILNEQQEELEKTKRTAEKELQKIEGDLESSERNFEYMKKQKIGKEEDKEVAQRQLIAFIREIEDIKHLIPQIYDSAQSLLNNAVLSSLPQMRAELEKGKVTFQQARDEDGIDPAAPENYRVAKEETDRLEEEFQRTSILLEQDEERTEKLKDQLETTINMRVLELQQRFKSYMSQFQFEGEISWGSYEDKKQRTHFQLYIKARKEGHRGALEDVSVKARGGKVGKGVSGGEESLSSLLFALVLLQNIQAVPGFIVLDEFDSALDENRKLKVFDLYVKELQRKLIILTPKSHEESYLGRFSRAFVVQHDPTIPKSKVVGILKV